MNMTKKQRTTLLIIAAALLAIYYGPTVILTTRQFLINRELAARQAAQPRVVQAAPKADTPKPTAPGPDAAPFPLSTITGFWQGAGTVPGRLCTLHLELRENPQAPGHMLGFPSMTCTAFGVEAMRKQAASPMLAAFNPTTGIMDGTWDKATTAIKFNVVKSLSSDNCPFTGLAVTPLGTTAITAEWKEGECQSGNVVMQRTNR
jgi:hypothetical protein